MEVAMRLVMRFAVLLAIATSVMSCGAFRSTGHLFGARAAEKDLCRLTVVNHTPYTFKFRVGHLWWEEQNGLLPGNSGVLKIEQDEEHEIVRVAWMDGHRQEDVYSFYVPKGRRDHTVTFGDVQYGIFVNRSGVSIRIKHKYSRNIVEVSANSVSVELMAEPPIARFVISFGPRYEKWKDFHKNIDVIRKDTIFEGKHYDWVTYIEPYHVPR